MIINNKKVHKIIPKLNFTWYCDKKGEEEGWIGGMDRGGGVGWQKSMHNI
jgi:hypothetical protein